MSEPRRKQDIKSGDSSEESKNVDELKENTAQPIKSAVDMQSKNQESDDDVKIQDDKSRARAEKILEVLDLQSKYRELSDNLKSLDQKVSTMSSKNVLNRPASTEKPDETSKVLEDMRGDLSSFIMYGKLFFGIGIAALMLYLINSIITLANWLRPAA